MQVLFDLVGTLHSVPPWEHFAYENELSRRKCSSVKNITIFYWPLKHKRIKLISVFIINTSGDYLSFTLFGEFVFACERCVKHTISHRIIFSSPRS